MQTRSSSKFVGEPSTNPTSTNPKRRNRRHSKQRVEPFALEEVPIVTMADQRTMAELLRAPTEGYVEAIVDLLRACPHLGFTELHQLDTFYNGLNPSDQDSLNSAAGGNLLKRSAQDIASAVASAMTAMFKQHQVTPAPASVKAVEESCVTCDGAHSYRQCPSTDGKTFSGYQDNIQGYQSPLEVAFLMNDPPILPPSSSLPKVMEREPEVTKDTVQPSTKNIQPPVVQIQAPIDEPVVAPKPKPSIPYPSRANKQKLYEKDDILALKFIEIFRELHFELSFADALLHMPKFASMFKNLLNNKEKMFDLVKTPVNENCLAVILKKLPEKLRDPDKFLIPCDFQGMVECLALADLVGQTSRYSYNNSESVNRIDVIDVSCEEYAQEVLGGDFILEEIKACLTNDSILPGINDADFDPERDIHLLEELLNNDPSSPLLSKELHFEEIKTIKSSIDDPPELALKDLPSHIVYAFLEGTDKLPL
ncbi:hypothetical protein Tco_0289997 [Tanacetum coccineum]